MQTRMLGPGFGAEVLGVGLADVVTRDEARDAVREAFDTYSVLLFRGQQVTDDLQEAFSRRFGPLETGKVASLGEGTPFSILTNVDRATGALVAPDHKESLRARANQLWHTDSSYKREPAVASVLSARVIPPSGGETEFASQRLAWDRLPVELRERLHDAFAWHSYSHSRDQRRCRRCAGASAGAIRPTGEIRSTSLPIPAPSKAWSLPKAPGCWPS